MDGLGEYYSKGNKSDRKRQISYLLTCKLKNMIQINLLTKPKQSHRFRELTYGYCYWEKWK